MQLVGAPHLTHAAAAQERIDRVGADRLTDERFFRQRHDGLLEKTLRFEQVAVRQQFLEHVRDVGVLE